jgi:hypothetical protein
MMISRLLRPAYLSATNVFALLPLLPVSDRDKDMEILTLRHQITLLERQLGDPTSADAIVSKASSTSTGMPLNRHG